MVKTINTLEWEYFSKNEESSIFLPLDVPAHDQAEIHLKVRSFLTVNVYARFGDNRLPLASGLKLDLVDRLSGCDGLELEVFGPTSYQLLASRIHMGTVTDPEPVLTAFEITPQDNLSLMVETAVRSAMARLEDKHVLREGVDVDELMDDILNGDHEFEEEEEEFGAGFMDDEEPEDRGPLAETKEPPQARVDSPPEDPPVVPAEPSVPIT